MYPYSLTQAPAKTPVCERRERFGRDAGMLERLDGDLEQQALLRIDAVGFARRDTEELGVETGDVAEKGAPPRGVRQCRRRFR